MQVIVRVYEAVGHGEGRRYHAVHHKEFVVEGHCGIDALALERLDGAHGLGAVHSAQARRGPRLHEAPIACHEEVRGRGRYGLAGLGGDLDEGGGLGVGGVGLEGHGGVGELSGRVGREDGVAHFEVGHGLGGAGRELHGGVAGEANGVVVITGAREETFVGGTASADAVRAAVCTERWRAGYENICERMLLCLE